MEQLNHLIFPIIVAGLLTGCANTPTAPIYFEAIQAGTANQQLFPYGPKRQVLQVQLASSNSGPNSSASISFPPWVEKKCQTTNNCRQAIVINKLIYSFSGKGSGTVVEGRLLSTSGGSANVNQRTPSTSLTYRTTLDPGVSLLPRDVVTDNFRLDFVQNHATLKGLYGSIVLVKIGNGEE